MAAGSPLGRLFGRSPIAPLQEHMLLAVRNVQLLEQLCAARIAADGERCAELLDQQQDSALGARDLHRELRRHLPGGLLLAVPRPDLLILLDRQQQVVLACRRAAEALALRDTQVPGPLQGQLGLLCASLVQSAEKARTAINELDEMIEQGFGDNERQRIDGFLDALDRQQTEGRELNQHFLRGIAASEEHLGTLDAMFMYRISDQLQAVARACGDVGEQLRLLLAD